MSRKLNSLSALFAVIGLVVVSSSAMGQIVSERKAAAGPRSAVVAVKRDGHLQLAGDKQKVVRALQGALRSVRQPGEVSDIRIQSFERASYLAARIEGRGTMYLQLVPSNGGIQGIWVVGGDSIYCSGSCSSCEVVSASIANNTGPTCNCASDVVGQGSNTGGTDCKLYPKFDFKQLAQAFDGELLAVGFDPADVSSPTGDGHVDKTPKLTVAPGRVDPIKRPNN